MPNGTSWVDIAGRYIRDPRYGHRLGKLYLSRGYLSKAGYYEHIKEQTTDQYGFVDNGYKRKLPEVFSEDENGIILIGGSGAMGLGSTDNSKTISALLEKNLRESMPEKKITVINAACGGYSSWEELIYFLLELINRKPKLVISITGQNDFNNGYLGSKYYSRRMTNTSRSLEDVAEAVKISNRSITFRELFMHKFKKTKIYRQIHNFIRKQKGKAILNNQNYLWGMEYIKEEYDISFVKNFIANQISLLGSCKAHNIHLHTYIQPTYFWSSNKTLTTYEKKGIDNDKKFLPDSWEEKSKRYISDLHNEIKKYKNNFDDKKYIMESLVNIFDENKEQCYVDMSHLSDQGQLIVANKIKENIISSKLLV